MIFPVVGRPLFVKVRDVRVVRVVRIVRVVRAVRVG
jgi:hypothetical protein